MTFEDGAIANDQCLGIHVADNRTWRLNLKLFFGLNLGHDLALDDDGNGADFSLQGCLLTDRYAGVCHYLAFNFSFDGRWPVKL
jgi:hypothetical protein